MRGPLSHLSRFRTGQPSSRGLLTPEQFQEELVLLGLSGKRFGPEEYVQALSDYLEVSISVHVIPDALCPELSRLLALSGRLGEVRYSEELGLAAIFVPESLPPLVSDLTVLHELGHLAAGDLLIAQAGDDLPERSYPGSRCATSAVRKGKRLARQLPLADQASREHEANLRASYALIAGCLGGDSPYVHGMYQVL